MKRIYLIDCPGVVPPSKADNDEDLLLRGVVRVEKLENPAQYVTAVMQKVQRRHLERTYGVRDWDDATEFLDRLARKSGKLLKHGEADVNAVAKVVLNDFLRGHIPWFTPPPGYEEAKKERVLGNTGRLGEMRGKWNVNNVKEDGGELDEMSSEEDEGGVELQDADAFEEEFADFSEDSSLDVGNGNSREALQWSLETDDDVDSSQLHVNN